jgi:parvulin-like peptidyl-prolyl isomerase
MNRLLFFFTLIFCFTTISSQQEISKKSEKALSKINSFMDALSYVGEHPKQKSIIQVFVENRDSSEIAKKCYSKKVGDIFLYRDTAYKIIETNDMSQYRASYIYLDGYQYSKSKVDSLRKVIINKYNQGVLFKQLVEDYNMDGNSTGGDLGWFQAGKMHKLFEEAVKTHKLEEIFTLDIEEYKWYYVAKKTHPNQIRMHVTCIKIKN